MLQFLVMVYSHRSKRWLQAEVLKKRENEERIYSFLSRYFESVLEFKTKEMEFKFQ